MKHGSLFTGIGAFDLAAEINDIKNVWNCEIEDYPRKILSKRFKDAEQYRDIRDMHHPEYVDIISGGFPCQNISIAGRQEGVNGIKSGLWREMWRVCGEVKPKYVIIENSNAILNRGFEHILQAFAEIGYNAEWQCLQGYQFGTPQRRRRMYAIFYTSSKRDRMEKSEIFSRWNKPIYTDWGSSENRVYGMANDIPNRVDRHRALGNAVMPIVADYLFKCIIRRERRIKTQTNNSTST